MSINVIPDLCLYNIFKKLEKKIGKKYKYALKIKTYKKKEEKW